MAALTHNMALQFPKYQILLHIVVLLCTAIFAGCQDSAIDYDGPVSNWEHFGKGLDGQRYSSLSQITTKNVNQLEVAWTYHTGDVSTGTATHGPTAATMTPIVINGAMYLCTPYNKVISLNPETGDENWKFDPEVNLAGVYTPTCRGVSFWESGEDGHCEKRILLGTVDARLIAIDADSGEICKDFGINGAVNLLDNLGNVRLAEYYVTSVPLIVDDIAITGAFVQDGQRVDAPPGVVRAFDIRSGELRWAHDPVPPGIEPVTAAQAKAGVNFTRSTPNVWGTLSADEEKGLVYLPTGGSQPDHYGGNERGDMDYYGTSVIAVNAKTGERVWHFQTVHHDIWDYDIGAQPVLYEHRNETPAVVAATKMGHIFLLHRETGEPLFPIEERAVPQTNVEGEYTAPTQPFPSLPKPLHPYPLEREDIWGLYPGDKTACQNQFDSFHYEGMFTPPPLKQKTLAWPGIGGGVNWGSVSINPQTNTMLVNSMRVPYTIELIPREEAGSLDGTDLVGSTPQEGTDYVVLRGGFLSPNNTPCTPPPWGVITAIDLDSGKQLWEKPLGNLEELAPFGIGKFMNWGTPNTGGTIQTASNLVFVGATLDGYIRAFDSTTGQRLWQQKLPAPAQATPITYRLKKRGKQFVAISAGGHGPLAYAALGPDNVGKLLGDAVVAFALPD